MLCFKVFSSFSKRLICKVSGTYKVKRSICQAVFLSRNVAYQDFWLEQLVSDQNREGQVKEIREGNRGQTCWFVKMLGKVKVAAYKEFIFFFLFNCILPTTDMSTDFVTYLDLRLDHPKWAVLTLSWMFLPFLLRFVQFLFKVRQVQCSVEMFLNVLKHLPFLLPMENLRKLVIMIKREYRNEEIRAKYVESFYRADVADVAANKYSFLSEIGDASLYESFCESGP